MDDLTKISKNYKTDKSGEHEYTKIYNLFMSKYKNEKIKLLEIGIGGYKESSLGGGSLLMWSEYFSEGMIYGLDIEKKEIELRKNIKIFQGSQVNEYDLNNIIKETGNLDFIIDDGSHLNSHQIKTFEILFPKLNYGGYYFIEDIQTSYFLKYGGDGFYLDNKKNAVNYFKRLVDKINFQEIENPFFKPDYFCKNITEIHFYHNLIVIKKEKNEEKSNILQDNKMVVKGKNLLSIRKFIKNSKYFFYLLLGKYRELIDILKF